MIVEIPSDELERIEEMVSLYRKEQRHFANLAAQLRLVADDPTLAPYIHSVKLRVKDPDHLRDKLKRQYVEATEKGESFDITTDNLFVRINDLAGLRILHLYTRQIGEINKVLKDVLAEQMYNVVEGPFARTWDTEYRDYFESLGIETRNSKRMYTSVHYIVQANMRTKRTGEIQVRRLAEEIWGEVDHILNYPQQSPLFACREQIKVLARLASSCGRLVDSIFATHEEGRPEGLTVTEGKVGDADAEIGQPELQ